MGLVLSVATIIGGFLFTALGCVGLQYRAKLLEQEAGLVPVAPYKRKWQIVVIAHFCVLFPFLVCLHLIQSARIKVDGLYHSQLKVPEAEGNCFFPIRPLIRPLRILPCTSSDNSLPSYQLRK